MAKNWIALEIEKKKAAVHKDFGKMQEMKKDLKALEATVYKGRNYALKEYLEACEDLILINWEIDSTTVQMEIDDQRVRVIRKEGKIVTNITLEWLKCRLGDEEANSIMDACTKEGDPKIECKHPDMRKKYAPPKSDTKKQKMDDL